MEKTNRRQFLKIAAASGLGVAVASKSLSAAPKNVLSADRMGVLVDTTICVGCRNCEWACKDAHGHANRPIESYNDRTVFTKFRRPGNEEFTVINEFKNPKNDLLPINVKSQCMHCDNPACVSACIVGAFSKQENGAVIWDTNKCIGCRYCLVACPFQVPTFDYEVAIEPAISKCDFCYPLTSEGKLPACVKICPVEALTFGPRSELIKLARERIKRHPENYINHIFGENEVGGTGWLYLSSRNFHEIGFPILPDKTAPGVSESIQHGIFAYFVPPVLFYSILGSIMWLTKKKKAKDVAEQMLVKESEDSHE